MALVTANGVGVIGGSITMPIVGVWTADLIIDQPDGKGFDANADVTIEAGDFQLKGVVDPKRTGDFLDAVHVRVIGGKAGLAKTATPKGFAQPGALVRDVLNSLMTDSGESLSSQIVTDLLTTNLVAWSIASMPVSQAMIALIDIVMPGNNWRILSDGTLWIGTETWVDSDLQFDILTRNPTEGTYDIGVDAPSITPGITLTGVGQVNRVEHEIHSDKIRAHVWTTLAEGGDSSFKSAIGAIVGQYIAGIDYLTMYDAKLVSQSSDLTTVDVTPQDPRLAGMVRVPLRHGLPGCKVQVSSGAFLRIGWDRGNPQYPFAALWNGGESVTKTVVEATTVYLGAELGAQFVALSNLVNTQLSDIQAALLAHTHTGVTVGSGVTGGSNSTYAAGNVAASQVKAV